jgi:hypothetical protein
VQYQLEQIRDGRYGLWLLNLLEKGFTGFDNMSDEQLQVELKNVDCKRSSTFQTRRWMKKTM